MRGTPGATRTRASSAVKPPFLSIDPEELSLDNNEIVFRHTRDGGYLCVGFGSAAQFLRAVDDDPAFGKAIDGSRGNIAGESNGCDRYLSRLAAAVALAKDYDPDQPRDEAGRWTSEGAAGVPEAAVAGVASATADALFGNPGLIPALQGLAARLLPSLPAAAGGAVAFFGTLFIPTNRSLTSEGKLPDAPDFSYSFDRDTSRLTVTHTHEDGTSEIVFEGRSSADGVFRDSDGNAIGRHLDGSVALDADAIRGYEARAKSRDPSRAGMAARTDAATNTNEPKLCPDPSKDKSGGKSPGALAYQMYVGMVVNGKALPIGLGIKMTRPNGKPVYLDDCRQTTGGLIEAKGLGYADQLEKGPNSYPWIGSLRDMLDQAGRQTEAARGRPIEWHFAEKEVADYMRPIFAERYPGIAVFYTPPPRRLIGTLKKIIERMLE